MMMVFGWILVALGAIVAFLGAAVIKKKEFKSDSLQAKCYYIVKIIGLWLVIIGAFLIFRENGTFGIK